MSGENSYFSRFFVKFVEVSAAGLATAISAYLLAHFAGCCGRCRQQAEPCAAAGHRCDRRAARA